MQRNNQPRTIGFVLAIYIFCAFLCISLSKHLLKIKSIMPIYSLIRRGFTPPNHFCASLSMVSVSSVTKIFAVPCLDNFFEISGCRSR
ncbi:MAG: hypothetical protein UY20_C0005G0008 [Candidatus Yanofskybacteria bacterium GW2011_GWA1_48_10]|uniref:Uncharacterized protein n=1 Tax=Candidatus Yanofskybacteria bacterium GW2011_GWA1_48_10 TaxID=1619022 RepID=A0A0G1U6R0_9BACT|nr:MAG: hypothetical protein UY20_C0005G0008 [Candidatus Yanofskybacteria bacterium GW2011_GWA1_48_10]